MANSKITLILVYNGCLQLRDVVCVIFELKVIRTKDNITSLELG